MWLFRSLLWVLCLAGCGFRPLYSEQDDQTVERLALIRVGSIEGRMGQIMRNQLVQGLNPSGEPAHAAYDLTVTLGSSERDLGIGKDATTTRAETTVSAHYVLKDRKTGKVIFEGRESESTDYNLIVDSYYSNIVAKNNAQKGAVQSVASLIKLGLATRLSQA